MNEQELASFQDPHYFPPQSPLLLRFNLTLFQGLQYPVPKPPTPSNSGSSTQPHKPPSSSFLRVPSTPG